MTTASPEYVQQRLREWGIRHFTAAELLRARRWGRLLDAPKRLIPRAERTILLGDHIRALLGDPVNLASFYRDDAYNRVVGGVADSQHLHFSAGDFSPKDRSRLDEFYAITTSVVHTAREAGWNIGLGYYDWGCHVDTDAIDRPANRTWDYRS